MTDRRRLLRGMVSSIAVAAGLGSVADDEIVAAQAEPADGSAENGNTEETAEETNETVSGVPGFAVTDVELRYEPHVGITTLVHLKNEAQPEYDTVRLITDAYDDGTVVGEDSAWETIPAPLERSVKLRIDNIFELVGVIGSVDEFVIEGRVPDGTFEELERFSGEAFREEIDFDGTVPPEEAEVEVEEEDEDDDDEIQIGPDDDDEDEPTDDDDEEEETNGIGDQIENGVPDDIPIGSIFD